MPANPAPSNDLMSAADAARILGLSSDMVRLLARHGRLRAAVTSVRGVRLFRRSDIEALAAERAGVRAHNHLVHFYSEEQALITVLADFLREGLLSGAPAIVIATESHRSALCSRLAGHGIEIEKTLASEQLTLVDARETLARICVNGWPDASSFQSMIGSIIAKHVPRAHARVRAFGEMVDLLWKDGLPDAARHLEKLWNDLADIHSFSLMCAYEMDNFGTSDDSGPFEQICGLHTRVVPVDGHLPEIVPELRDAQIARLQQRAHALDAEIDRRKRVEAELREIKAELARHLAEAAKQGSST